MNDINEVLKKYGQDPLNFLGQTSEKQIEEMNRLSSYLKQFAYRIFSPNSRTFQKIRFFQNPREFQKLVEENINDNTKNNKLGKIF